MVRFSDCMISVNNAFLLATIIATSNCSSREDEVLPPGSSEICCGVSAGTPSCTRKWWASGRLCSTVSEKEVKEPFGDEAALEADILHRY